MKEPVSDPLEPAAQLNRRQIFAALLVTVCGAAVWRHWPARSRNDFGFAFATRIVRLLGLTAQSPRLGFSVASGADIEGCLARVLNVERSELPAYAAFDDHVLRQHLRNRIKIDYMEGAMVSVQGWWLAATEFRVFDLAARLPEAAPLEPNRAAKDNRQAWQPLQKQLRRG